MCGCRCSKEEANLRKDAFLCSLPPVQHVMEGAIARMTGRQSSPFTLGRHERHVGSGRTNRDNHVGEYLQCGSVR